MISVNCKKDCCGCSACVQACPEQCVKLAEDHEGFLYPDFVDKDCVECGKCVKVCPMRRSAEPQTPAEVYAAANPDEYVRERSSSGGIFSLIAEYVIGQGGVVFGAAFDEKWNVVHSYAETLDGIEKFRGAKYVQSGIGSSYIDAERFLKAGRLVMFSGTPCQIAGLKSFLRKGYGNLLAVDCVCHGVPSPGIFKEYIADESNGKPISGISFRDKKNGWKNYNVTLSYKMLNVSREHNEDSYMRGFLGDLYLRPSCYDCRFREGRSGSDITLGDFWGIDKIRPELDDDKGLSLVIVNNKQTDDLLRTLGCNLTEMPLIDAIRHNPSVTTSASVPPYRSLFFAAQRHFGLDFALKLCLDSSALYRIIRKIGFLFGRHLIYP